MSFRSISLPLLGLNLSCLVRPLVKGVRGLIRVVEEESYRALPRRRTLVHEPTNHIWGLMKFE